MQKKKRFVERFMEVTGKTSAFLGPANRSPMESKGKHRLPNEEEQALMKYTDSTWELHTTPEGEHYVVEKTATL
jgi:hypothetical protein